jgi:hypothetical protein
VSDNNGRMSRAKSTGASSTAFVVVGIERLKAESKARNKEWKLQGMVMG